MLSAHDQFLDTLLALPTMSSSSTGPEVSPDGRWVAWTWFNTAPVGEVFVAPTDGSAPPVRLTTSDNHSILASWTPDSRAVLVRQDHHGDERFRLFRVELERPSVLVPLTEASPQYFLRGGQLHPNGRWLVYAANYDFEAGQEIETTRTYRHDLVTGEHLVLTRPERAAYYVPALNKPGTHVLYARRDRHVSGQQIWLADIEGQTDREILNFGDACKVFASWLPDGERVLFLAEIGGYRRVGLWERATGETRWLLDDPARSIESAYVPRGSGQAVLLEVKGARVQPSLLDVTSGVETRLPAVPGNLVPLAPAENGQWVGRYYSARQPSDLVRFAPDDVRPDAFTSLARVWERTPLRAPDLVPAEDFHWQSVDELDIQGWLYRTPVAPARGTLVLIHGGPSAHSQDALDAQIQFFAAQGFNVLDPNYRGSTGFGLAFREAIKVDGWGGREQDDIAAGIAALVRAGIAVPGRIGVTGTSYGGYSAWHLITHCTRAQVAAAAPICGMTDLVVDYETTRPDLRSYSEEMLGGRPDQVPARYHERSPVHFVEHIEGDLLIVQGAKDPNVTPESVRVVCAALERVGRPYAVLTFDDEGHGIRKPANQRVLYRRLAQFFAEAFQAS